MTTVVVGGGIGGLTAARDAARRGDAVVLLEAEERLGGMVTDVTVGGVRVDAGAEAYATRTDAVRELCTELGLAVAAPSGRPHIFWPETGESWPVAEGLLGIPASLSDPALLAIAEEDRPTAAADVAAASAPRAARITVADLVSVHLGRAVVDRLVAPLTLGVYGMTPDRMPVAQFAPGLLEAVEREGSLVAAVASLTTGRASVEQPVGGMFRLVGALAADLAALGADVRTSSRVAGLARDGDGWVVDTIGGSIRADRVVLAVPARVATRLLGGLGVHVTPPRTSVSRNILLALRHPALAAAPVGSGVLLGHPTPSLTAKALTHYTAKWPWAAGDDVEIVRLAWPADREPTVAEALADAATLTGVPLTDEHLADHANNAWKEMPRALAPADREALQEAIAGLPGLSVTSAWLAGNGLGAVVADARRAAA